MHTLCSPELLCLTGTPNTTVKSSERDDLLVFLNISEVRIGFGQFETWTKFSIGYQYIANSRSNKPVKAAATSRMFLKWVRTYSPRERAARDESSMVSNLQLTAENY